MRGITFDWAGVVTGQPAQWLLSGFLTTVYVTVAGCVLASAVALVVVALRLAPGRVGRYAAGTFVEIFLNTPILVQMLFWYFAAYGLLPRTWRLFINADHPWAVLPVNVIVLAPEFLCAAWGLGLFTAVFLAQELRTGLNAVPKGQTEAAMAQGLSSWQTLRFVLLPQALVNAWQPLVGQYLNLMKLSSLATGIGLAELTSQVRKIESYNAHSLEAFAVGTAIYLSLGVAMGRLLLLVGPKRPDRKRSAPPERAGALVVASSARGSDGI
jgi:polar amino acid transport system permease protein